MSDDIMKTEYPNEKQRRAICERQSQKSLATFKNLLEAKQGDRTVVARITTTSVDRDGDVLIPGGMDASSYKQNPVVLFAHDAGSFPIGKAPKITRTSDDVTARVEFAKRPPEHPITEEWAADTVLSLFQQGILNAFSVGFRVKDGGIRKAESKDISRFGDGVRQVITDWELVELSVVPVPANQDALAVAVSKGCNLGQVGKFWNIRLPLEISVPSPLVLEQVEPLRL
jgi:HK97 family phage prohead protease